MGSPPGWGLLERVAPLQWELREQEEAQAALRLGVEGEAECLPQRGGLLEGWPVLAGLARPGELQKALLGPEGLPAVELFYASGCQPGD